MEFVLESCLWVRFQELLIHEFVQLEKDCFENEWKFQKKRLINSYLTLCFRQLE